MNSSKRYLLAAGAIVLIGAGIGTAVVSATSGDDTEIDTPISGTDLDRASDAALQHTGQGRVTDTEVGDEESMYEVEVTLDDGSEIDVQLDENFEVVSATGDAENSSDADE